MGNLADTFIVRLKPEFKEPNIEQIMPLIPKPYQQMFCILWDHFYSLEDILDTDRFAGIEAMKLEESPPHVVFAHRYRGQCLQQILRQSFFETLLIVQNVYSPWKHNFFHVLRKNEACEVRVFQHWLSYRHDGLGARCQVAISASDILTEEQWATTPSDDEAFSQKAKEDLEAKGFQVHTED